MLADALRTARVSVEVVVALVLGGVVADLAFTLLAAPVAVPVVAGLGAAVSLGSKRVVLGAAYAVGVATYAAILLWVLTTVTTPYW
jgi:hypothetical protein